jgi:hypothetical protein
VTQGIGAKPSSEHSSLGRQQAKSAIAGDVMTGGLVNVPIVFVRCSGRDRVVARAAVSSTWFGVAREAVLTDATEFLEIRHADTNQYNVGRLQLLDNELAAVAASDLGVEITRHNAANIFYALEEAVPEASHFHLASMAIATRATTVERPARVRLQQWIAAGGDAPPRLEGD